MGKRMQRQHHWLRCCITFWIFVALTSATAPAFFAHAMTYTVINTQDSGAGSLRQTLADAPSGSIVNFAPNVSGVIVLSSTITLTKSVTIVGSTGSRIAVSGNDAVRVLRVNEDITVAIFSLDIIHGKTTVDNYSEYGGGVFSQGQLTLTDVTISDNFSLRGGGIEILLGRVVLNQSRVVNNRSTRATYYISEGGGGISIEHGVLELNRTVVQSNQTEGSGGGIDCLYGLVRVNESTISNNSSSNSGAGVSNFRGELSVTNSTFSGNRSTSANGGGVYTAGDTVITGTTFVGNYARYDGGAIIGAGATIRNSTISGNYAEFDGGGIDAALGTIIDSSTIAGNIAYRGGGMSTSSWGAGGAPQIIRTIIADNTSKAQYDIDGYVRSNGYNLVQKVDSTFTPASTDMLGKGASLGALEQNGGSTLTMRLLEGSLAIDTGGATCLATDQRGTARPQRGACDIGAFEAIPLPSTVPQPRPSPPSNGSNVLPAPIQRPSGDAAGISSTPLPLPTRR